MAMYLSCFVCYKPVSWAGGHRVPVAFADGKFSLADQSSKNVNVQCACGLLLAGSSYLHIWAEKGKPRYLLG